MAVKDIRRESVKEAISIFRDRDRDREGLLREYGGGRSRTLYIESDGELFDLKLITRIAHARQFGMPLAPMGAEWFNSRRAESHMDELGFRVVRKLPAEFAT